MPLSPCPAPPGRRMRGTSTEAISRRPITPVWIWPVMFISAMPLRRFSTIRIDSSMPSMRARAAEDADPAQKDHGDDVQLEPVGRIAAHRADAGGVEQAREGRDRRRRAMNRIILMPGDVDAGEFAPPRVGADDHGSCGRSRSGRSTMQSSDEQHDEERSARRGSGRSGPSGRGASNQSGKSPRPRSSTSTRARPRKPISVASVTTSEGMPTRAMKQRVERAAEQRRCARQIGDGERRRRCPVLDQPAEGAGGQAHDRGDGEVDLGVDDDEGHHQGDDDLLDRQLEQVDLVAARSGTAATAWR